MAQTTIERPFQLPQHLYGLWFEVGQKLGLMVQATIFVALTDPHFRVYDKKLSEGERTMLKNMASARGILLQFP